MERHPELSAVIRLVRVKPERLVPIGVVAAARLEGPEPFVRALAAAIEDGSLNADATMGLLHQLSALGPALNPLKAVAHKMFATTFAIPPREQTMSGVDVPETLTPLTKALDGLTNTLIEGVSAIIDPKSGRLPTNSDGSPLFPDHLLSYRANRSRSMTVATAVPYSSAAEIAAR